MRRWFVVLSTWAVVGCSGGSEEASNPPAQAPSTGAATSTPRPAAFPSADQFRLGDTVMLWVTGLEGPIECNKLYFQGSLVAVVQSFAHTGSQAIARRCLSQDWSDPFAPTAAELAAVGEEIDGSLAASYDNVVLGADGSLGFEPLEMPDLFGVGSVAGSRLAYYAARDVHETDNGREATMVGIIYDIPASMAFQEVALGTCVLVPPDSDEILALAAPDWSSDGDAVVFEGDENRCSFGAVEAHPE